MIKTKVSYQEIYKVPTHFYKIRYFIKISLILTSFE